MKFNLKLFVVVGVLAGFRDVCGTENINNKDYDDFIVAELEGNEEKNALIAAIDRNRVIKAVYKTGLGGKVDLIHSDFQGQLSSILVLEGEKAGVKEIDNFDVNENNRICENMKQDVEYTVYFIFKNELLNRTASMFYWCERLIRADFRFFNTTNVNDMSNMFYGCIALTKLDLSTFDTKNVIDMSYMFQGCSALTKLDLSSFDTKNVTDMSSMFFGCTALKELNLSSFDTKNVTDMSRMFYNCKSLKELNLSKFNTKNVTNMPNMFRGCTALKELDLRNFYFSLACKMDDILDDCNFNNLCIPQTYAKTRKRCWCCCCRYVYLEGKVVARLNQNNVEFVDDVQDDLIGS